jgi:hypothetical protein
MQFDFDTDTEITPFDMPLEIDGFDLGTLPNAAIKTDLCKIKRYPRPGKVKYEKAIDLARNLPEINEGEAVFAIVSGNFIFGDFLEAYMVENNLFAREILIATLSLGQENVDSLKNIQDGGFVGKMGLVVSDYWYAHELRRKGGVPYIMDTLGNNENFMFASAGIHTKIILVRTDCGKNMVLHGSSNLRSSRNLEQFCIENNRDLYDFNAEWITGLLEDFTVTQKSKRGGKLWRQVTERTKSAI